MKRRGKTCAPRAMLMNPKTSAPSALGLSPNTKSVSFVLTVTAEITDSKTGNKLQNKTVFRLGSDSDGKHIQNAVQLATSDTRARTQAYCLRFH